MSLALKMCTVILSKVDRFPSKFQILSKFHMSLSLKNCTFVLSGLPVFPLTPSPHPFPVPFSSGDWSYSFPEIEK
jgi:hypothetical protein